MLFVAWFRFRLRFRFRFRFRFLYWYPSVGLPSKKAYLLVSRIKQGWAKENGLDVEGACLMVSVCSYCTHSSHFLNKTSVCDSVFQYSVPGNPDHWVLHNPMTCVNPDALKAKIEICSIE